jgi:ATP-dependent Lhr-like helicase
VSDGATAVRPAARAADVLDYLREHGASFFAAIHQGTGQGFPQETVDALWELVWTGLITNDTLHPLRAYVRAEPARAARRGRAAPFRSRRLVPPTAEGRWSLLETRRPTTAAATEWGAAMAQQLLTRHGVVTRETVAAEAVAGGFSAVYAVLKAMEAAGRIRRGYFVAGLGGAQFAMPAAVEQLRSLREIPDRPRTAVVAATDPANPYGSIVTWPDGGTIEASGRGPTRTVGSLVMLVDGLASAYVRRGERELLLFAPEAEPRRSQVIREVARALRLLAASRDEGRRGLLIAEINGTPAPAHAAARLFVDAGFASTAMGLQLRPDGIRIAEPDRGGLAMAKQKRDAPPQETATGDHDRIRSSNDRDEAMEREGTAAGHNRGYDEAVKGRDASGEETREDVDPDSATAENDRDDMLKE